MKTSIETREVIAVNAGGVCLRGTYHKPRNEYAGGMSGPEEKKRTGVLFLSGSVEPRAAFGDSAVYWAERVARSGFRSFRFDLPGIGDSDGELPQTEVAFRSVVNAGAFSDSVCRIVDELAGRFDLAKVIVVGHCSGAVTALYAAAANERIKGVVVLDPYFDVQPESKLQNALVSWHWRIIGRFVGNGSPQAYLRAVRLHSSLRSIYRRQMRLPGTANLPLVRSWNQLISRRLRILVLRSPAFTPKPGEFDYIGNLQSDRDSRITVKLIEGATHDFAESHAREAVRTYIEQWLSGNLTSSGSAETSDRAISSELAGAAQLKDLSVH